MKIPMMKLGGGGFIAWLVGAVLLIVAWFSGARPGIYDLSFKVGDTATAVLGTGLVIEAIGMILVGVGCFGMWKEYRNVEHKTALPSATGAVGIVAGVVSMVTGISFISGQTIAIMFILTLIASLIVASFMLLLGLSMFLLQERMGKGMAMPAGIMSLIAACSYLYGLSTIALVLVPTTVLCMIAFFNAKATGSESE